MSKQYLLGLDIGSSSVKASLVDADFFFTVSKLPAWLAIGTIWMVGKTIKWI